MADYIEEVLRKVNHAEKVRAEAMPTERDALAVMAAAKKRLEDLGFRDAVYCPKDGTVFDAVEAGCTATLPCSYDGEWPKGRWWSYDGGDMWPCRPTLFRLVSDTDGKGQ